MEQQYDVDRSFLKTTEDAAVIVRLTPDFQKLLDESANLSLEFFSPTSGAIYIADKKYCSFKVAREPYKVISYGMMY